MGLTFFHPEEARSLRVLVARLWADNPKPACTIQSETCLYHTIRSLPVPYNPKSACTILSEACALYKCTISYANVSYTIRMYHKLYKCTIQYTIVPYSIHLYYTLYNCTILYTTATSDPGHLDHGQSLGGTTAVSSRPWSCCMLGQAFTRRFMAI